MALAVVTFKQFKPWSVALQSGLLLAASWFPIGFPLLLLYAFVPLLLWENRILQQRDLKGNQSSKIFFYSFIAFSIFTLSRTWWVAMSAWFAIIVPFFEASLMALFFTMYHWMRIWIGNSKRTMLFFPLLWLIFESINTSWDLNFPWLNIGNGFADFPGLVQWYEYTGVGGGTLWITLTNAFVALTIRSINRYEMYLRYVFVTFCLVFAPPLISLIMYWSYEPDMSKPADIVLLQPNLDPYHEQYSLSADSVTSILLAMASAEVDKKTDYVVAPESCLQEYAWEHNIMNVGSIEKILQFNENYPRLNWIAGMSTRRLLPIGQKSVAARYIRGTDSLFYDCSNVALSIGRANQYDNLSIRRKIYLTPTVEKMPLKKYIPFLESLALNLGGTVGTLAIDDSIRCFHNTNTGITSSALICYESVVGGLVRKFTLTGNQVLFCITNDGWWGNTQGYRQHKSLSRLRAIENRRYVCRAANTGTSCFIAPNGDILQQTDYWQRQSLKSTIYLQDQRTFYVRHGDYIYRWAGWMLIVAVFLPPLLFLLRLMGLLLPAKKQQKKG
ncbi:MAG: apolipoprotein N-acyltransferase [Bacteroidales bacterium]|nr:apolipoprotein N-acyltransferase [Bacteroidales bacterium]